MEATIKLPPLTEAMTAKDLWRHERALRDALGPKGRAALEVLFP